MHYVLHCYQDSETGCRLLLLEADQVVLSGIDHVLLSIQLLEHEDATSCNLAV